MHRRNLHKSARRTSGNPLPRSKRAGVRPLNGFETLEDRRLLTVVPAPFAGPMRPVPLPELITQPAAGDTSGIAPVDALAGPPALQQFQFDDSDRWSTTVTSGSGLGQGDPTTLTWSIVPDGTSIFGYVGEPTSNSDLISFLGSIYGVTTADSNLQDEPWFGLFEDYLERWGELSGLSYVYEPNDDGAAFTQFALPGGQSGVRGDVRIGGHFIDGESGTNTLAYNFFPNFGDMVIDTGNPIFYGDTANNSLALRNVLAHEHGHGIGLSHVCPVISTIDGRLMEPFINLNFDGPQFDDILATQRGYGDVLEKSGGNDTSATASSLGTLGLGQTLILGTDANDNRVDPSETDFVSIDDDSDTDFFSFTAASGQMVDITLTPLGPSYLSGPQNPDGSCSAGTTFDAASQSDLRLELIDTDGTTSLLVADANGLGQTETIANFTLPASGNYFVRVSGAQNAAQMYQLEVSRCHCGDR